MCACLRLCFSAGSVPLNSTTAEKELRHLRVRRKQLKSRNASLDQVSGFDGQNVMFLFCLYRGHAKFMGHN